MARALPLARALVLLAVSTLFVGAVFQVSRDTFWRNGLGDWMDPYFINYLLEHWHHAVRTLSSPASPPMYFPAPRTLGYSHGLILYAPFYIVARIFLHPFQAYSVSLMLVIETGILCLYVLLRRGFSLSFLEALLLTVFFFTSLNVLNGFVGVWSQRASVFLIPPILLLLFTARRLPPSGTRTSLAAMSGFLAASMFTQDFYSGFFAAVFAVCAAIPPLLARSRGTALALKRFWSECTRGTRVAIAIASSFAVWTLLIAASGGFALYLFGGRIASHDWRRPLIAALVSMAVVAAHLRRHPARARLERGGWVIPFALGGAAALGVFLWIYSGAYAEHPAFPEEHLNSSLVAIDTSGWRSPLDLFRHLAGYETLRTFKLVFAIGIAALFPWRHVDRRIRAVSVWALFLSAIVLMIPMSFNGFSLWKVAFAPLPGFSVIRDPKRIAYLYELAAVLAVAALMSRLPRRSVLRVSTALLVLILIVSERNHTVFDYERPNATFDRWIGAPLAVNPSCRSFFAARLGPEYEKRLTDRWALYSIDAMFVALKTSVPTLNGFSAWFPNGWAFQDPADPGYDNAVRLWISNNRLSGVCELNLERRTIEPGQTIKP